MKIQEQYILTLASKGARIDKRKPHEFRKIEVEKNYLEKPEGSARVRIGNTEVIAGVKIDVGEPFSDRPDEGVLMTGAEFSPIASPNFEKGPPTEDAVELARVVDRGIRESGSIDTKKLCIKSGEKVWMVFVDIHIINHDGNLIDAAALASIIALHNTKMPEYSGGKVNYDKKTKSLPVKYKPIALTFSKIGDKIFIDPSLEEENASVARLTITTMDNGNICAMQKGGPEPLTRDEIDSMMELSIKKGEEMRKKFL